MLAPSPFPPSSRLSPHPSPLASPTSSLASVQQEKVKSIAKKLCDTISELAAGLLPDDPWPELLPFIFQSITSDNPRLQESALLIFSQLAQYIGDTLLPHLPTLQSVLSHTTSVDVRIAALGAAINLVQCLPSAADSDHFNDLLPAMMCTLTESLNSGKEATAQEALEFLIELAGTEPPTFGCHQRHAPDCLGRSPRGGYTPSCCQVRDHACRGTGAVLLELGPGWRGG